MSNVVVKQGQPSAPGTVVDTSAAKVVPSSSEVRTEAAAREVAAQSKATQAKINSLAKKMTHPARAKDEAVKAATGKGSTKAKLAAKTRGAGNGSGPTKRLTMEWLAAKGKDVQVKDQVKLPDGIVIEVIGRWTKRKGDQLIPMVTGCIVSAEGKGNRRNAVAAEVTHVAKK